jgi:hypothetical protein
MKDRYDALKAIALILGRMGKIAEEIGKPGTLLGSLQYEWNKLETKYQKLMDRLAELPHKGKQACRDGGPGHQRVTRVSRRNFLPDN